MAGALFLGLLAGCQGATQDTLNVESPQARQARRAEQAPKPQEAIGTGPTRIGLITALMANSGDNQRERDVQDGAVLAVDELGDGQLSLRIENTDGTPQQVRDAAKRLADQGARLIAVSAAGVPMSVVRDGASPRDVPLLALRGNSAERSAGSFAFASDRIDSAVEGAAYAVASGRKRLLVLLPADVSASERQRLERGLAGYKVKPVLVATTGAVSFSGDAASKAKIKDIDSVLLVGAGEADVGSLSQLRANAYLTPNAMVLGSSQWPTTAFGRPELTHSYLCLFGPENGSRMTTRFRQRYERSANLDAAYGFDVIALAAGLLRTQGESGINRQNILSPNGFLGAAAAFRFEQGGSVQRTCAIYQIVNGKPNLADPAPRSF